MTDKLKAVAGPGDKKGKSGSANDTSTAKSTDDSWSNGSKTPPSNGSKSPTIRFDPIQIVGPNDSKPMQL